MSYEVANQAGACGTGMSMATSLRGVVSLVDLLTNTVTPQSPYHPATKENSTTTHPPSPLTSLLPG